MTKRLAAALSKAFRTLRRAAPGPLLIRALAFVAGTIAVSIALPGQWLMPQTMLCGAIAAALAAIMPGSVVVGGVQLCTVGLWMVGTTTGSIEVTTSTLLALASALYVQHSASALAAAVPLDAVVLPWVLIRWFLRTSGVLAVTSVLCLLVFAVRDGLQVSPNLVYPLLGAGIVIAITVALGYLALRTPRSGA